MSASGSSIRSTRARPPVDGRVKGSGLGLAIAREYALAHGGRIEVLDRADRERGAHFRLWLPLADGDAERDRRPRRERRAVTHGGRRMSARAGFARRGASSDRRSRAARRRRRPSAAAARPRWCARGARRRRSPRRRRHPAPVIESPAARAGHAAPVVPEHAAESSRLRPSTPPLEPLTEPPTAPADDRSRPTSSSSASVLVDLQRYGAMNADEVRREQNARHAAARAPAHRLQSHPARGALHAREDAAGRPARGAAARHAW